MTEEAKTSGRKKLVYVLPRVRITSTAHPENDVTIAKATFLLDEPSSWSNVLKFPRPAWLDIFRDFPPLHGNTEPAPAHGTLIVSDDEDWLKTHISRIISLAFLMGVEENWWRVPADAFQYSFFTATESPHDLVSLHTKTRGNIEEPRSLQLYPPLELRGISGGFRIRLNEELHRELIRRFSQNPYDRIVAACYHLFRTQFDNPIVTSAEQDFAAYCACLEAALDIQGPDCSKELMGRLTSLYGQHTAMERWIKGLYSERSVFNHGIPAEPSSTSTDDRLRALTEFRERNLSWDVLRKLCLDVIQDQLRKSVDAEREQLARMMRPITKLLRQFFDSEKLWNEIAKVFTQHKSVQTILALSGKEHDDFLELCCAFLNGHSWQAMKGKADLNKVCDALMAMAAVFGEKAKKKDVEKEVRAADELFQSAQSRDTDKIDSWARRHAEWPERLSVMNTGDAAKAVAAHTAMFFVRM
ncbi:MAG: hypothetical protein GXX96_35950 [Planctomycetaceae bacterium]|nr:hypothetical protein [Planctomycetaceae bacterium]